MFLASSPAPPFESPAAWGAFVLAYLLGAVPFGLLMARLKGIDLRAVGSGNIGATNTMRALGKPLGVFAFALDFGKGWLPVSWLAPTLVPGDASLQVACGAAAVLGHCFPVYLGFRGGKGVATGCGAIVGIDPLTFLVGGLVWLLALGLMRMVSLASILMGVSFPIIAWLRRPGESELICGAALLTFLILVRHRSNIGRMLAGTEARIGSNGGTRDSESSDG